MRRVARIVPGGMILHVLNRGNARSQIFEHCRDYDALERVMVETGDRLAIKILAYCCSVAKRLGLESALHAHGRPEKSKT